MRLVRDEADGVYTSLPETHVLLDRRFQNPIVLQWNMDLEMDFQRHERSYLCQSSRVRVSIV